MPSGEILIPVGVLNAAAAPIPLTRDVVVPEPASNVEVREVRSSLNTLCVPAEV